MLQDPFSSVFTTLASDGGHNLAFLQEHLQRMERHAERLDIKLPKDIEEKIRDGIKNIPIDLEPDAIPPSLVTIRVTEEGDFQISGRANTKYRNTVSAISVTAPIWSKRVRGTKHGAWQPYLDAKKHARKSGADVALLIDNGAIIDADRATPVLLDQDGTLWVADNKQGGVDSITLQIILPELEKAGMPVNKGRIHEKMIGRAKEIILVGTGIGVVRIEEIDGQEIGDEEEGPLYKIAKNSWHNSLLEAWGDDEA